MPGTTQEPAENIFRETFKNILFRSLRVSVVFSGLNNGVRWPLELTAGSSASLQNVWPLPREHPALKAQWEHGIWVKSPPQRCQALLALIRCPRARVQELIHLPHICFPPSPSLCSSRYPLLCCQVLAQKHAHVTSFFPLSRIFTLISWTHVWI